MIRENRLQYFFGDMLDVQNIGHYNPNERAEEEAEIKQILQQANNEMYLLTSRTKRHKLSKKQKKQIDILLKDYEADTNIGLYLD